FEAALLVETQPLPVARRSVPINALVLDAAAVLLGGLGWALLLFCAYQPAPFPSESFWTLNSWYFLAMLGGAAAVGFSARLLGLAYGLYNTFRFWSDVLWLRFTGTYTTSKIGVGDGRGGQFFSHRDRIQSDIGIEFCAARIISECTTPRAWAAP